MAGYVIGEIEITDPTKFELYRARVHATIERHGGRYLVRGGKAEGIEGAPPQRMVLLEFPTFEAARTWYFSPDYQEIIGLRFAGSNGRLMLVEGV